MFKPGDIVKCVVATIDRPEEPLYRGCLYVVAELSNNGGVRLEGGVTYWIPNRFELFIDPPVLEERPHIHEPVMYDTGLPNSRKFQYCKTCDKELS